MFKLFKQDNLVTHNYFADSAFFGPLTKNNPQRWLINKRGGIVLNLKRRRRGVGEEIISQTQGDGGPEQMYMQLSL